MHTNSLAPSVACLARLLAAALQRVLHSLMILLDMFVEAPTALGHRFLRFVVLSNLPVCGRRPGDGSEPVCCLFQSTDGGTSWATCPASFGLDLLLLDLDATENVSMLPPFRTSDSLLHAPTGLRYPLVFHTDDRGVLHFRRALFNGWWCFV